MYFATNKTSKGTWGLFLESPSNFLGPKSNIQIKIWRIRVPVLANKLLHFVPLTDSFIILDAKLLKPQSLMWKETAYRAVLSSGLSRNGPLGPCALWKLFCCLKLVVNSCSGQIIWFEKKYFPQKSFQELWLEHKCIVFLNRKQVIVMATLSWKQSVFFFDNCSQAGLGAKFCFRAV